MKKKADLEKEKKTLVDSATEKEIILKNKIGTIGNIVHDSVPIENNEVCHTISSRKDVLISARISMPFRETGRPQV
jgi:hypothetical protein